MTQAPPVVSIVIPTHNRRDLIGETIQSVLDQTFEDFEILVVDNGSTDDTQQGVCDVGDPRIKYTYQEDTGGPAGPRNTGIRQARGKYIAFLDSDDLWLPHKLEHQIGFLEQHPDVALIFGQYISFGDDSMKQTPVPSHRWARSGRVFSELLLSTNFIPCLTVMVRRDVLDQTGGFDEDPALKTVEDFDLWLRIARCHPIHFLSDVIAKYRIHQTNLGAAGVERWFLRNVNLALKFRDRGWISNLLFAKWIRVSFSAAIRRLFRERNFGVFFRLVRYLYFLLLYR